MFYHDSCGGLQSSQGYPCTHNRNDIQMALFHSTVVWSCYYFLPMLLLSWSFWNLEKFIVGKKKRFLHTSYLDFFILHLGIFFSCHIFCIYWKSFLKKTLSFCLIFLLYLVTSDLVFELPAHLLLKSVRRCCLVTSHTQIWFNFSSSRLYCI